MNEREIADWEREIKHAQKMQEQLRDKKKIEKANALMASLQNPKKYMTYEVKDNDNEINNQ